MKYIKEEITNNEKFLTNIFYNENKEFIINQRTRNELESSIVYIKQDEAIILLEFLKDNIK